MDETPTKPRKTSGGVILLGFLGFEVAIAFIVKASHVTGAAGIILYLAPVLLVLYILSKSEGT
jgi:hypothetical protein